mgnify:CR=1 FL=1
MLILIPTVSTANDAVLGYLLQLSSALGKLAGVHVFNGIDPVQLNEAVGLVSTGRASHWVCFSNIGTMFESHEPVARAEAARFLGDTRTRYCHVDLDHPALIPNLIRSLPAGSLYTNSSGGLLPFARELTGEAVVAATFAHGAEDAGALPWAERDIDCLFAGNLGQSPDQILREWDEGLPGMPPLGRRFLHAMREIHHGRDGWRLPPEQLLRKVNPASAWNIVDRPGDLFLLRQFDRYARARARFDLIDKVRHAPVSFLGRGWDAHAGPNHRLLGGTDARGAMEVSRRARLILNVTAPYYASHERVFQALSMAAAVAGYARDVLANATGREQPADPVVTLDPWTIDESLCALLADDAALRARAEAGRDIFLAGHTWEHRAGAFLGLLETLPPL